MRLKTSQRPEHVALSVPQGVILQELLLGFLTSVVTFLLLQAVCIVEGRPSLGLLTVEYRDLLRSQLSACSKTISE